MISGSSHFLGYTLPKEFGKDLGKWEKKSDGKIEITIWFTKKGDGEPFHRMRDILEEQVEEERLEEERLISSNTGG